MRRLINQHPGRAAGLALGVLPFIALLVMYIIASHLRLAENPDDKLLPALGKIASTFHSYAFEEDVRSGKVLFWADTWASLKRIGSALVISATFGMLLAICMYVGSKRSLRLALLPSVAPPGNSMPTASTVFAPSPNKP